MSATVEDREHRPATGRGTTEGRTGRRAGGWRARAAASIAALALAATGIGTAPALGASAPTPAASTLDGEQVASPDGSLVVTLAVVDGRLAYDAVRDGSTTVVAPSGLGMRLTEPAVDLTADMSIDSVERSTTDESWTPAWGTSSRVRNHYDELVAHTVNEGSGVRLDVTIRVFDDGFGLRYTFPQQSVLGAFNVTDELTQFSLPDTATAYYLTSGTNNDADERHYLTAPVTSVATAQTPITLTAGGSLVLSVHEADLTDYPSMTLVKDSSAPGRLVSSLIALPGGLKAVLDVSDEAFSTPWRTVNVGRTPGDLAESHLIENLNDACAICDVDSDDDGTDDTTDWITPATYTGVWWELQRRATTWNAGSTHGATTARVKQYIDLAASAGAKFVLAEGWNVNAGGSWTNQDFLTPMSDFDLPEVLSYAASKGVGYIAHNETRGYVDYYDEHMEEIFSQYEAWGVHAIKTGYATRFILGGVQRSHFDQEGVRHFQRVIETAARHHITIDAHEAIKPTGLARTYPNMMTGEGIAGMEQENYKGANGNPPEQKTILPFTRFMGGPADYTPGVLAVTWDPANLGTRVQSTVANQLALYTTFFSPMQMLADTPENYAANAEAFEYLKGMPTTWDESHVPLAVIGDYTVTERRSGSTWYLGAVTDENDRTVAVPLSFLEPGTTYVADIYADAAATTWKGNPTAIDVRHVLVDSTDTLRASMVGGGGQAARFRVATADDIAELDDLAPAHLSVTGDVTSTYDAESRASTIRATVHNDGTEVSTVRLFVDGVAVGDSVRLDGGASQAVEITVPVDAVPYRATHAVAFGNGVDEPSAVSRLALAPYPDTGLSADVALLVQDGGLDADLGQRIGRLLDESVTLAGEGDLDGVTLKMQSIRLALGDASTVDVGPDAYTAIEDVVSRWLGAAAGLPDLLSEIRRAESQGTVTTSVADLLREDASEAFRAAIRTDGATRVTALARLAASTAAVDVDGSLATLQAKIAAQRSAPVTLQAESSALSGGASTSTEHAGYTGTGFVKNLTKLGACVAFDTSAIAAGRYTVTARFANGMIIVPLDRQLTLSVGTASTTLLFPNQGQDDLRWKRWAETVGYPVTLHTGDPVKICYEADDTGNINLDAVTFAPFTGVIPRSGATERPTVAVSTDPSAPDGDAGWWRHAPAVQVAASGPGAVSEVRVDDGAWNREDSATLSSDGVHQVRARAVSDDDVSQETVVEVPVDGTAPVSVATLDAGSRTVTARAADDTSGVDRIEVRTGAGGAFEPYTGPVTVGAERTTLTFRAVDRAGNTETAYDVVVPRAGGDPLEVAVSATAPSGGVELGQDARVDVRVAGSGAEPSGWVEVLEGETVLVRTDLSAARATALVPDLAVGDHELSVRYGGDDVYLAGETTVHVTVRPAGSTLSLVVPSAPVERGDAVAVEAHASGAGVREGDVVRFSVNGEETGTAQVGADGTATWLLDTTGLPLGSVVVSAVLEATATTLASERTDTLRLRLTPVPVTLGSPLLSTSTAVYRDARRAVTATTTVSGAASGTVTFTSGDRILGTAPVRAGRATLTLPRDLSVGVYRVVASLPATSATEAATSPGSTLTVVRTTVTGLRVTGKKFRKHRPVKVKVRVSTTTTNGLATAGKVKVQVGKKVARTVSAAKLRKKGGKATVTLPRRFAKGKKIKVRAVYVPADTRNVAKAKSAKTRIHRR